MKAKHLSVVLPFALTGLSSPAWSAAVDTETNNNTFANPDSWNWKSDNANVAAVNENSGDVRDFFRLTGFVPGSQVRVTITYTNTDPDDGPVQLDAFNTAQVDVDNIGLTGTLSTIQITTPGDSTSTTVTIPPNGILGLRVTDMDTVDDATEGYRITIEVLSVPTTSVPVAAWPVVPLLGAAGLAALRRKQKRPTEKRAA